jgi:hypothetical protein
MLHYHTSTNCVRYYYLSARYGNSPEIIKVLYSQNKIVDVPMWEENISLEPFHSRALTPHEQIDCQGKEVWDIFMTWDELFAEEDKFEVETQELIVLENFKDHLFLPKSMVA